MTWTPWLSGGLEPGGRGSSSVQDSSSVFKTQNFLNFALNFYIHIHVWGELASHKRSLTHPPHFSRLGIQVYICLCGL